MSFENIPGQERAKGMLQNSLRNHRISHAYLFHGPAGTGKRKIANAMAQAILCEELEDDACGHCLECRKVEHGNHPNLYLIEPDGTNIKLDQVRELQKQFSYRSGSEQTKIYIIHNADRLTIQAANSLLKFLEEPVSPVVAILITDNGQAVLPTIQSRSQWIPFLPVPPQMMADFLVSEGMTPTLVRAAVHLTAGLEAAREIIQFNWFAEMRNVVIQLAKECYNRLASVILTAQLKVVKTELADHVEVMLELFTLWFKDMIYAQSYNKERIVFIDQAEWIADHAFTRTAGFWVGCIEKALEMHKRLRSNVNPQLAFEQFLFEIQGVDKVV